MPITNVTVLERAEAKIEAVRGTPEATMTRYLYPIQGSLTWTHEISTDDTKEAYGGYYATEAQTMGIPINRINFEGVVTYEEVVWWLNTILKGSTLTGNSLGGVPVAYDYTFSPTVATDDLASFTMKVGDGTNIYKFHRCMVNRATFRFNPQSGGDAHWHMALEIWALGIAAGESFNAPAETARTKVLSKGTKLYSDATGGTIGTTQATALLRSGSIVIDNQLEEKIFAENTTAVHTDVARGEQIVTAELVAEFANDTYFGYFRAATRRQLRIIQTGATISGANPYTLRFDMQRAHIVSFTPGRTGQNRTATIGIVAEIERASSILRPLTGYVINASASITA